MNKLQAQSLSITREEEGPHSDNQSLMDTKPRASGSNASCTSDRNYLSGSAQDLRLRVKPYRLIHE